MYYVDICTISICIIYMYYIGWNIAHDICHKSISHISSIRTKQKFQQDSDNESDLNIKLAFIFSP